MIHLENIKVRYKGSATNALDNVSLRIKKGQTLAIVGHNGAGKSTLIKVITNLLPYEGSISYDFDRKQLYEKIRVQMQTSQFEKGIKVKDVVEFYLVMNDSDESIDHLLDIVNLKKYRNTFIERLSGGEKQRLAILLTIIGNAEIVIFDEITTGLDSVARRQVWDFLQTIKKERDLTIILTSHFLEEVEYLADEVVVMKEGKVLKQATIDQVVAETFGNRRTIRFLTDPAFNWDLIHYEVQKVNNGYEIEYEADEEPIVYQTLIKAKAFNMEVSRYTFEDAMLRISGYEFEREGQ